MTTKTPYQLLGKEIIYLIACTFYDVMDEMPQAEKIRKMHSIHKGDIKKKLYEYLVGWLGGPCIYQDNTGAVCLTEPHKKYSIGEIERDAWLTCWYEALERVGISEEVKLMLKEPVFHLANSICNK